MYLSQKTKNLLKEKLDLLNFIKALHDDEFLSNPAFSKPEKFPDQQ